MRIGLIASCLVLFLTGFAQVRETETGLKHEFLLNKEGRSAKVGDLVTLHMLVEAADGTIIRDSWKEGKPILFPSRVSSFDADIYEAVRLMSEGDSAQFWVNADSMYLKVFKKEKPTNVKSGSNLRLVIATDKIRTQQAYKDEQTQYYSSNLKESTEVVEKRKKKEETQIQQYIKTSGFKFIKTKGGAYYTIVDADGGALQYPKKEQAVVFGYVGSFLDGKVFESTEKDVGHAVTFTLGTNAVIKGWEEVFPFIPKGGKARIIVPSHLGYGNIAKDKIPANSVLIFDVNVVAIY